MGRYFIYGNDAKVEKEVNIKQLNFEKKLRKFGIDLVSISTDEDFVDPLLSFFKSREKNISDIPINFFSICPIF